MNPSSRPCRPTFLAFAVLVGGVFASADALATERPSVPAAESLPASAASADDEAGEPTLPNAAAIDGAIDLSAHAGKVVYIDFWASWCVPCRAAFPWLNALQAELGDEGLVILGVNTGDTPEGAARFLEQVPADFPLLDFVAQAALHGMIEAGRGGSIINTSSQMGLVGGVDRTVYCASKWGIEGLTRALAIEAAPHRVRVNTICPTFVRTPLTAPTFADPERVRWIEEKIKLGRVAEIEDMMGPVVFLASEAAAMITGTSLVVDGGWTAG